MTGSDNPFRHIAEAYAQADSEGREIPLGNLAPARIPVLSDDAERAVIFAPHPDDECIIGGLPLRLLREAGIRVSNVAVTLGSNLKRRDARREELTHACEYLGFGLIHTGEGGLERVTLQARASDPEAWETSVGVIADIIREQEPRVISCPHADDWHPSHIGTHYLVADALKQMPGDYTCTIFESEFWGAMDDPNLMVESSIEDVGDLMAALSLHIGEVARNPYHVRMPAWMLDNVRRGGELIGGQGKTPPRFQFTTLYRIGRWKDGAIHPVGDGLFISAEDSVSDLLNR